MFYKAFSTPFVARSAPRNGLKTAEKNVNIEMFNATGA
jgi:hypothetical protein